MTPNMIQDEITVLLLKLRENKPSRELSLVITKLQEAKLWATQIPEDQ